MGSKFSLKVVDPLPIYFATHTSNSMAESLPKQGEAAPAPKKKHEDVETQNLEKFADYVEESENSEELGKVRCITASGFLF